MERIHKKIWRQRANTHKIKKLFVYLNNFCNLKCSYCFYVNEKEKLSSLSISHFKKILNFLLNNLDELSITVLGGEPFLSRRKLNQIIKICYLNKIPLTIFTNGTLIDKRYINTAKRYNIKTVISIDGNLHTNDKERKFKYSNKSVYKYVIEKLKKLKIIDSVAINMVVTPKNVHFLSKNIMHLYKIGFKEIGISFDYSNKWEKKTILKLKSEVNKIFKDYISLINYNNPYKFSNMYELFHKINKKIVEPCSNITISSTGEIYPCDKIISMNKKEATKFKLKNDILAEREIFFKKMAKMELKDYQGFCDIGTYLYLKYYKKIDEKNLIKKLNEIRNTKKEIEDIFTYYFKILLQIPKFRKIHNI